MARSAAPAVPMFLTIRSRENDAKVLRFFNVFCFWSDRSITDAKRDSDRKLTRLRTAVGRFPLACHFALIRQARSWTITTSCRDGASDFGDGSAARDEIACINDGPFGGGGRSHSGRLDENYSVRVRG